MHITPLKTPIVQPHDELWPILRAGLPKSLVERTIVVVTSKIVGLCEGRVVPKKDGSKEEKRHLVEQEAEYYVDPRTSKSKYDIMLTMKHAILAVNAGIDESNVHDQYVLFPSDPMASAQKIWQFLRSEYNLEEVGVLITDSRTMPLKWGQMGTSLAYCGFSPLNDNRGLPDLFGRELVMTQVNVAESLAVAAVLEMGEAAESTPLALITEVPMVQFLTRPPTAEDVAALVIAPDDDVYAPVVMAAAWQPGGKAP